MLLVDGIRRYLRSWTLPPLELPEHLRIGLDGERVAFDYLRKKRYMVVASRWRCRNLPGEIDLIAWQGKLLCIVEVKTRTAKDEHPPEASVDMHKRALIRRMARQYLNRLPGEVAPEVRFDIVSVILNGKNKPTVTHFENAFGWQERPYN